MQNPRKTLTLKPGVASEETATARKRVGGRAKQVSQRARQQAQPTKPVQPPRSPKQTSQAQQTLTPDAARVSKPGRSSSPAHRPKPVQEHTQAQRQAVYEPSAHAAQRYTVFAPCPQGLEQALASELQVLGFADARAARAGCQFTADWHGIRRANLYSRLATRMLVRLAHAPVAREDDVYALAHDTPWEQWFGPRERLRVDTSAIRSPMRSLHFCNLRVKDGICDRLRDREGARPDIDTIRPDARVHVFLDETSATLYLDTSGESLFKRGWRLEKGEAPLRENLASGLLALAGWQPHQVLLDPFCGSGTILIEAASIAAGIPAGMARPFGFERLRNHVARDWRDVKDAARAAVRPQLDVPLLGGDADADMIAAARANANRAGLPADAITWRVGDALDLRTDAAPGWILTNPPYGARMDAVAAAFWSSWSAQLKRQYADWQIGVISSDMDFPKHLRLKPQRRIPVHNGSLDCRLFLFEMVQSRYRRPETQGRGSSC